MSSTKVATSKLSEEERKARNRIYQKNWYANNKEKRAAHYQENKERLNAAEKTRRAANPDRATNTNLQRLYGITLEQRDEMFLSQGSVCAICKTEDPSGKGWNVDHCHNSGEVRGILCLHCNTLLGYARDNPTTLRKAAEYLEH